MQFQLQRNQNLSNGRKQKLKPAAAKTTSNEDGSKASEAIAENTICTLHLMKNIDWLWLFQTTRIDWSYNIMDFDAQKHEPHQDKKDHWIAIYNTVGDSYNNLIGNIDQFLNKVCMSEEDNVNVLSLSWLWETLQKEVWLGSWSIFSKLANLLGCVWIVSIWAQQPNFWLWTCGTCGCHELHQLSLYPVAVGSSLMETHEYNGAAIRVLLSQMVNEI